MKKALITGIGGQDGSYLAELLLEKGYDVHGFVRRNEFEDPRRLMPNISDVLERVKLHAISLDNYGEVESAVSALRPDECYHLAAHSFVYSSSGGDYHTFLSNVESAKNMMAAIRVGVPDCRFYFAGSSEIFGNASTSPQNENTPFNPRNMYGLSKLVGYHLMKMERDKGLFACAGFLFNHESPRRGHAFVTRKITSTVARIAKGANEKLKLGDLDARRDWGYSPDYVRAMWLMLQQDKPGDYVIASGKTHSVREFADLAFRVAGLDYKDYLQIDQALVRKSETVELRGDSTKAEKILGWKPETSFEELIELMIKSDLDETSD